LRSWRLDALGIEQDEPETRANVDHDRTRAAVVRLKRCRTGGDGIYETSLPPYRLPAIHSVLGPVVISRDKEAA
jgi:hypothetical protein